MYFDFFSLLAGSETGPGTKTRSSAQAAKSEKNGKVEKMEWLLQTGPGPAWHAAGGLAGRPNGPDQAAVVLPRRRWGKKQSILGHFSLSEGPKVKKYFSYIHGGN